MTFEHSYEESVGIIKLAGRLTAAESKQLRSELNGASRGAIPNLVLDITELSFVDSTGLGVLAGWLQKVRSEDGEMVLVNPTPEIKALLELTRLDQVFTIHESRQAAIQAFH